MSARICHNPAPSSSRHGSETRQQNSSQALKRKAASAAKGTSRKPRATVATAEEQPTAAAVVPRSASRVPRLTELADEALNAAFRLRGEWLLPERADVPTPYEQHSSV